jgi:hypothetical protein
MASPTAVGDAQHSSTIVASGFGSEHIINTLSSVAYLAVVLQILMQYCLEQFAQDGAEQEHATNNATTTTTTTMSTSSDDYQPYKPIAHLASEVWPLVLHSVRTSVINNGVASSTWTPVFDRLQSLPAAACQAVEARSYAFLKCLYHLRTILTSTSVCSLLDEDQELVDRLVEPTTLESLFDVSLGIRPMWLEEQQETATTTTTTTTTNSQSACATIAERIGGPTCIEQLAKRWLSDFVTLPGSGGGGDGDGDAMEETTSLPTSALSIATLCKRIDVPPISRVFEFIALETSYDRLLLSYTNRACSSCNTTCQIQALCLLCGTIVCYGNMCCTKNGLGECTRVCIIGAYSNRQKRLVTNVLRDCDCVCVCVSYSMYEHAPMEMASFCYSPVVWYYY